MNVLFLKLKALFQKGLFHIMGSTVINKSIAFFSNIFLVRILTKYDYGVFSSAFNVFLIVSLFTGFGITSATLYFASEKENEDTRTAVYSFSKFYGFIVSIILCLSILIYGLFFKVGIEESRPYIITLSGLPIFNFYVDYFAIILRSRKENKKYALLLNINSASYALFAIVGSALFGIIGTILGRYISYFITAITGFIFTKQYIRQPRTNYFQNMNQKKEIVKYAAYSGCVTALNNILYRIDISLISLLVADATLLASYKVSAVVPENMNFIPQSIIIVFLPLFIENRENHNWVKNKAKELFKSMAVVCGSLSFLMIVFSKLIIKILWGEQYLDGLNYFRILSISFFFLGVFRSTSTNILQAFGKVKYNLYVSIIAGASNIILDIILIHYWSALGAALATLFVTIIASCISFPYLIHVLKNKNSYEHTTEQQH